MKKALVLLAPGCEEMEAVIIIDVLRRAGINVCAAGLEAGVLTASRGVRLLPDVALDDLADAKDYDVIVLPGGMPGTMALRADLRVRDLLLWYQSAGRLVAAICAAPLVLDAHGLLDGKTYTCYPGADKEIQGGTRRNQAVVEDGNLVTSMGPGTAIDFALTLVRRLAGAEAEKSVAAGLLWSR